MATTEELLQTILQSLEKVEYIKSEDIPNIDLYMDQVLTFMDRKLRSAVRPQTEDRVLTKMCIFRWPTFHALSGHVPSQACGVGTIHGHATGTPGRGGTVSQTFYGFSQIVCRTARVYP